MKTLELENVAKTKICVLQDAFWLYSPGFQRAMDAVVSELDTVEIRVSESLINSSIELSLTTEQSMLIPGRSLSWDIYPNPSPGGGGML